jgi:hypothetical protein
LVELSGLQLVQASSDSGSAFSLSSRALMATITVLADINTAPSAGVSRH